MANAEGSFKKVDNRSFTWAETDEPHATRRQIILQKYPKIRELFVNEPLTFVLVAIIFTIQITMAYLLRDSHIGVVLLCAYIIGGTLNHSLQLASHELSHNLCWSSPSLNKLTAIFSNFVTGFPSSITFQRYHMDHHQYQGVDAIDTDIPSDFELSNFNNSLLKLIWLFFNPIWYAFRPLFYKPKPLSAWEIINWLAQVAFNFSVVYFLGVQPMVYLVTGTLLGLGVHPAAGHFIAEHYEFIRGQETYSYYGPLNYVNFNVGYHNEHHDFLVFHGVNYH
jgi:sphingolipid delta-4 desaturase